MELGEIIKFLEERDPEKVVPIGFTNPHSSRFYYHDLGVEPVKSVTIGSMLEDLRSAVGRTFRGHDGEDYKMCEDVYVRIAYKGRGAAIETTRILMTYMMGETPEIPISGELGVWE